MKYALVNPKWTFEGSIYFGCREPHLPLEYGYAKALLERAGHEAQIIDGHMEDLSHQQIRRRIQERAPDVTVITTAPSYLFWRCAPPELRVPQELARELRPVTRLLVAVGPHASTTPAAALRKLGVDAVILGECEQVLPRLEGDWNDLSSIAYWKDGRVRVQGGPHASDMRQLPPLHWPAETIGKHRHQHHRFDAPANGPGAEIEVSRGCPYHCTFCAKENFRNLYRKRPLQFVLEEIDRLIDCAVEYVYFIDEIHLPDKELLHELIGRPIKFGIQTRIDLWSHEMLDLLGEAGCVSIEAGIESITEEGRDLLEKKCRLRTEELAERLIYARRTVPFVQANLLAMEQDDAAAVEAFRRRLQSAGVWANKPVPLFPYPGSPDYALRWGFPDDQAWERAHEYYLNVFRDFSDIQEEHPHPLRELELPAGEHIQR